MKFFEVFLIYRERFILALLALFSLAVHVLPFLLNGPHPLGYDTGFYRRYLIEPFISFPNTPVPGLGDDAIIPRLVLDTLRVLPLSTDHILYGSYLFFFVALPILLYIYLKPYIGIRGAAISALILIFSAVQYNTYWYMLWKHAFAACLFFLALIAFERRWTVLLLLLDVGIAWSHKTTALLYLLTLAGLFIVRSNDRARIAIHIFITALAFVVVNTTLFHQVSLASPVAVFLSTQEFLLLSVPLFLVLVAGTVWKASSLPTSLLAFAGVSFIFPIFQLPFYERIFIYCDIALVALVGFAIERMVRDMSLTEPSARTYIVGGVLCIALGLHAGFFWNEVRSLSPLMTEDRIQIIEDIGSRVPKGATILTTADEAPWFQGWTDDHIAAPGMLYDSHNFEEWVEFWTATSSEYQIAFLQELPQPLYVASLDGIEHLIGTPPSCLTRITEELFHNTCDTRN